jgi:hypothetical protein
LIAAIGGGLLVRRMRMLQAGSTVLFGIVLGAVLSLHAFDSLKRSSYPLPKPRTDMKTIAFDCSPSRQEMPLKNLVQNERQSINTFYVWTQRMGLVPSLHPTMIDALRAAPLAVVADPSRSLSIEEIDAVVDFCRRGGNLLLIANPRNAQSSANEFLGIFRMSMGKTVVDSTYVMNIKGERICVAKYAGTVAGGIPLLTIPGGGVVLAYEKLGPGRFFAFSDFAVFTQRVMGPTSVDPTKEQREIYELEYQLLEILQGARKPEAIEPYRIPGKARGAS